MTDTAAINTNKGLCPSCGRWIPLTRGGRLRAHHPNGAKCGGSKPAAKVKLHIAEVRFSVRKLP